MLPAVPDRAVDELGRTEGGPETLGLLVRDQHTRRLLLLRAVLDAAEAAAPDICPAAALARLRDDWSLLEEAERLEPPAHRRGRHLGDVPGDGRPDGPVPGPGWPGGFGPEPGRPGDALPAPGRPYGFARASAHASASPFSSPPPDGRTTAPAYATTGSPLVPEEVYGPPGPSSVSGGPYGPPGSPLVPDGPAGPAGLPPVAEEGTTARRLPPPSPVRALLLHPFIGPWARDALRTLGAGTGPRTAGDIHEQALALAHFGALAAVAAARAGVSYRLRLTAHDGVLTLPSLGALRTGGPGCGARDVTVVHRRGRLTLRARGEADVVVRLESGAGAWSEAAAWTPAYTLPGLLPGSAPVPLDDLDPYRTARGGPRPDTLSGPADLDEADRKHWLHTWSGTAAALGTGGERRLAESVTLLRCLVPLAVPPGSVPGGTGGSCSGTRREAFGAVLSSAPATATAFAATLVHEIQHTKLAALGDMTALHHAGPAPRHFAPWRPDPRPYDGLLQGAYSHLALADFFQRSALSATLTTRRDAAWAQHARYQAQVGAVLPALVGSSDLTVRGRRFVDRMVEVYERLAEQPPPRGHAARATAYVRAARTLWNQRHAPGG
ncbi:aKG-HExxH-type peptide beta-hydroxylase [Streptomyces populi]|uniref:aKG-HExxH-type peptide beta-hydroxylase n=1 Tax=Streptomyces populi TaxID=2058924 RepID=UPI001F0CC00B|nr:HEXXH motif-containing putative peptide modification protein [Streptomyces populi]